MKFIRINLGSQKIRVENVPFQYLGLGGRELISLYINDCIPPVCDPLGPDNILIFAPGLLGDTNLVNSGRIAVGAKSPLTGTIKESNAGGTFGDSAGRLGITAIIIEDSAPPGQSWLLRINMDGEAQLSPAYEYRGMRTYALIEALFKSYGPRNSIMCVGPAGEQMLAAASISGRRINRRLKPQIEPFCMKLHPWHRWSFVFG